LGFEEFYDNDTVLLLQKCLCGLNQAAMAFYRELLAAASKIGFKQISADPCLYYKLEGGRLVIMISWINDNMIVGPSNLVLKLKSDLMEQFNVTTVESLQSTSGTRLNVLVKMHSDWFRLF
jgi:hypothetical protein